MDTATKEEMMSLIEAMGKVSERIKSQRHLLTNEPATVMVSVLPFINALGYDIFDLNEVCPEYIADANPKGGERVDYAILRDGRPVIFIECKSASLNLTHTHWKQLYNYVNAKELRFGILTNGLEYRFYADLKKPNILDEEPFLTVDMLNLDEGLAKDLEPFTRGGFDEEHIMAKAKKRRVMDLLQMELAQPSDALVHLIADQIHDGRIEPAVMLQYRELIKEAWREFDGRVSPPLPEREIPIYADFQGQRFEAKLLVKKHLNWHEDWIYTFYEGEWTGHAIAAKKAMQRVNPDIKTVNGSTFWRFKHPETGEEMRIGQLFKNAAMCLSILRAP